MGRTDRGNVVGFLGSIKNLLRDHKFKEKSVTMIGFIFWPFLYKFCPWVGEAFHVIRIVAWAGEYDQRLCTAEVQDTGRGTTRCQREWVEWLIVECKLGKDTREAIVQGTKNSTNVRRPMDWKGRWIQRLAGGRGSTECAGNTGRGRWAWKGDLGGFEVRGANEVRLGSWQWVVKKD